MYIIAGKEIADEIRERYIVLELETINGVTSYCVVKPESIALGEMADLERLMRLHQHVASCLADEDYDRVEETIPHLMGKFGGELDSFYQVIGERISGSKQA